MKRSKRAQRTKQREWCFLIFKSVLRQNRKLSKREGEKKNNGDKMKKVQPCQHLPHAVMHLQLEMVPPSQRGAIRDTVALK